MARLIEKKDQSPIEIKQGSKSVFICACGLSKNQPFCDGSHHKTKDEKKGVLYRYKEDGTSEEVKKT